MVEAHREQLDERNQELWDQKGAVGALAGLAQTIRNCAKEVSYAVEGVALELDKERRGDLSVLQRSCNVTVRDTILSLLDEQMLREDEREDTCSRVLAMLQCKGAQ